MRIPAAGAFAWLLLAPVARAGEPARPDAATVTIEGRRLPVRRAFFGIDVEDERWDPTAKRWLYGLVNARVRYWLHVEVDERSGEDGALRPEAEDIPVRREAGRHPSLEDLGSLTVRERDDGSDCEEWDAWFGNDAPLLCRNVMRFQGWDGRRFRVRWESTYDDRGTERPLVFEGPVDLAGITVQVPRATDPDAFLDRAWGGQPSSTFDRHLLGETDHGEKWPAGRRYQWTHAYLPKGMPLVFWTPWKKP